MEETYNIPCLDGVVTAVDGFDADGDGFNTGDVDGDTVWNKYTRAHFF